MLEQRFLSKASALPSSNFLSSVEQNRTEQNRKNSSVGRDLQQPCSLTQGTSAFPLIIKYDEGINKSRILPSLL